MKKISLKVKSIVTMMLFAALLSMIGIVISYSVYSNTMDEHYKTYAMNIAKAAASQMNGDKISEYIKKVEALDCEAEDYYDSLLNIKDDSYYDMLNILFDLKESLNALYLYVEKVSAENVIYILDADQEGSACELGKTYPVAGDNHKYLNSLEKGVPAFITNTKDFGWLCTAGAPIFDSNGKVVALAFTDISIEKIMADRYQFLLFICFSLIITAALATTIIILFINKYVISHINSLSAAASQFVYDKDINDMEIVKESTISKLDIHTGDEIEKLSEAIK
ncbi:MAG: hypothetical protein PHF63_13695, partial [Herbinix sp.]|nr:hypothetical protein [Herbinix sp.]